MWGHVTTMVERLYAYLGMDEPDEVHQTAADGGTARAGAAVRSASSLFRCPDCETVYVARDKQTCRTCGTDVVDVDSTVPNSTDW